MPPAIDSSSDGLANTNKPEGGTSVLGFCSYYQRFVKNFSQIAAPLNQLLMKDVPFEWNPNHLFTFELLLHRLTTASVLQYPDFTKPFIIETDASSMGFRAILIQEDTEGKRHQIAYVSRTTNIHENNYSETELECCALMYALKQFRVYVYRYQSRYH